MVITQAPFRISFFGGGTDFPEFFKRNGGKVISTSIDKYCYVHVRNLPPFFEHKYEITYSRKECVRTIPEIQHPLIRECLRFLDIDDIILSYDADLPGRTGLGTSSSFAVSMLLGLYAQAGLYVDKKRLAEEAILLERELCAESGGLQDQIAASYGGFNEISFYGESFSVKPITIAQERKTLLNDNLFLFFTGFSRFSSGIQDEYKKNIPKNEDNLLRMLELADLALKTLTEGDIDDFGILLDETWRLKRGLASVISTNHIDRIYARAMSAGALGGKLLGAGGGGFLLFYIPKARQGNVLHALSDLMRIPFKFETGGAQIIYYRA